MPKICGRDVVVGGGLLGASIVRALKIGSPNDHIVWFTGTERKTASTDHNKIIRTLYPDELYVRLAQDGMNHWQDHKCFHQIGWVAGVRKGAQSKRKSPSDIKISIEEYQSMVGSDEAPRLFETEELWHSRTVGCADTAYALQLVKDEVKALGVEVREVDVRRILTGDDGSCRGVEVDAEVPYEMLADKVIVSVGPWMPQLLEASKIPFPDGILRIIGLVVGILRLTDTDMKTLNMDMPMSVGDEGEVIVSKRHNLLKLTTPRTFEVESINKLHDHPMARDASANIAVLRKWFPQFENRDIERWVCPDLLTVDGRFIIDEVPGTKNLIAASGGSFHSAKFFPNFGSLVQRYLGKGEPNALFDEVLKGCKWERPYEVQHVYPGVIPKPAKD